MITVAILGGDQETVELAGALAADRRFQLVGIFDAGRWDEAYRVASPGVPRSDGWEALLVAGPRIVLVGADRSPELADDQLRKLVQAGLPLALPQPACEAILALELEMIRRDTRAPLAVRFAGGRHPAVRRIAQLVRARADGSPRKIEQIQFERHFERRGREHVLAQFARDVTWWLSWAGDVRQVSALGGSDASDELGNLSVQMTSASGQLARWSAQPAATDEPDCVRLLSGDSRITLTMPRDGVPWRLVDSTGFDESYPAPRATDDLEILAELAQVADAASVPDKATVSGPNHSSSESGGTATLEANWSTAVRALETLDAVLVGLKRGRTVELQKTQVSEQHTFKGMMSAVGCLLLLIAPLFLIGAAVIDRLQASFQPRVTQSGKVDPATDKSSGSSAAGETGSENSPTSGDSAQDGAREGSSADGARRKFPWLGVALAAPLVFFLALQSLHLVFPRRETSVDE